MDFSFTEEQNLLRDSVRKFVEKSYTWDKRQRLLESEAGFSRENWASFAELGWTALPFAEADGGIGGKAVDTMIVLEELGKGLVLEPFIATVIFAGGILRRADEKSRAKHLPKLIGGEAVYAVAYAETGSRFDLFHVETTAKAKDKGYVLQGRKLAVIAGNAADVLIVSARTSGATRDKSGITLFAIDAKQSGVQRVGYRTVDGLHAANITLEGVSVGPENVIGTLDQGLPLLEGAADETIVALGAEAVGVMQIMFEQTVAFCKERKQFGVPIGSFQVLQHRMVDMYMEYEQAKSMLYMATMAQDSGQNLAKAAAALKVQLGRSGRQIGQAAIQNHGGMGMTEELAISHYFKRITMIDMMLGNSDYHLERYRSLPG
ncbi:MAG TPA: acyl-CoA dehydrogenase family protein [Polyangiales bacterium]|nr:acyl-CoA dehydrogenase family protein [Polyangiales bacterium]